jgi:hypothetical protein
MYDFPLVSETYWRTGEAVLLRTDGAKEEQAVYHHLRKKDSRKKQT